MLNDSLCPFDADELLGGDPFDGDYGDGERILSDKVCRVRKEFSCQSCAIAWPVRSWARVRKEAGPDGIVTFRWCAECCEADILANDDGGDARDARSAIGEAIRAGASEVEVGHFIKAAWVARDEALQERQEREDEPVDIRFCNQYDQDLRNAEPDEHLHEEDC